MFKLLRAAVLLLPLLAAGPGFGTEAAFNATQFDALNKEGKPMLISIHADWCPTCRAQAPIVSSLLKTPELKEITAFRVDFDDQKDVVRRFKANSQSTLIVFKGGKEVGRSIGDTRQEGIAALMKKAI